jgi:zinc transport system substrate-binding protein
VEDVFAEGEPSPRQLAEWSIFCKANGVTTIFAEKMASPAVSETLASEVGARVGNHLIHREREDGKTYLERMEAI